MSEIQSWRLSANGATVALPRFDPAQGRLLGVSFRVDATVAARLGLENMEARPATMPVLLPAGVTAQLGGITLVSAGNGSTPIAVPTLAAYDGTADFAGASGAWLEGLSASFAGTQGSTDPALLAALTGAGSAELDLVRNLWLSAGGGANALLDSQASLDAALTVEYAYVPPSGAVGSGVWLGGHLSSYIYDLRGISFDVPVLPSSVIVGTQRFTVADRTTGWQERLPVAQFDPEAGTLLGVNLDLSGNIAAGAALENRGAVTDVQVWQSADLTLQWSDGTALPITGTATVNHSTTLGAADGTDDFAGPGGWISAGRSASGHAALSLDSGLAPFIGDGTVALDLVSRGTGGLQTRQPDLLARLDARGGAQLDIAYRYIPTDQNRFTVHAGEVATLSGRGLDAAARDLVIHVEAGGTLGTSGTVHARNVTITLDEGARLGPTEFSIAAETVTLNGGGSGPYLGSPIRLMEPSWPPPETTITLSARTCAVIDTRTNQPVAVTPADYAGPVANLDHELIRLTAENLNVAPATDNWFIRTGDGTDAIAAHGGTNVLDGGGGSNFLVGADGADSFFVDARGGPADLWSTIVGFGAGDTATIWGITAGQTLDWQDNQGVPGATGLTLHAAGVSMTLAGITAVATSFGRIDGNDYLFITPV